jgi:hypothetical protein
LIWWQRDGGKESLSGRRKQLTKRMWYVEIQTEEERRKRRRSEARRRRRASLWSGRKEKKAKKVEGGEKHRSLFTSFSFREDSEVNPFFPSFFLLLLRLSLAASGLPRRSLSERPILGRERERERGRREQGSHGRQRQRRRPLQRRHRSGARPASLGARHRPAAPEHRGDGEPRHALGPEEYRAALEEQRVQPQGKGEGERESESENADLIFASCHPSPASPASFLAISRLALHCTALSATRCRPKSRKEGERARGERGTRRSENAAAAGRVPLFVSSLCLPPSHFPLSFPRSSSSPLEPKQRFAAVIMRIRDPKTTALIFASGKMASRGKRE